MHEAESLNGLGDARCKRHDLDSLVGEERGRRSRTISSGRFRITNALEPELFRRTALLACQSEILEFPTKQNWFDTDNDHFRSAVGTCRRRFCFGWRVWNCHVISFRRSDVERTPRRVLVLVCEEGPDALQGHLGHSSMGRIRMAAPAGSFALKLRHSADACHGRRRVAADLRPTIPAAHT